MLRCVDCAVNWNTIIVKLRNKEAYVYPLLYSDLLRSVRKRLRELAYIEVRKYVYEDGMKKPVTYIHIPVVDMTHDLVISVQWTGHKRFDATSITNSLYSIKYSKDIWRFKSSSETCSFIHTHGRFTELRGRHVAEVIDKYMLVKSGLWRYTTSPGCGGIAQFTYTNNVSLSLVKQDYCIENSMGFMTGKVPSEDHSKTLVDADFLKDLYIFPPRGSYLYKYTLDAVLITSRESSCEGLSISRKKIEVYSIFPLSRKGMYIAIRPKISDIRFKPLIIGEVPRNKLPQYLSAHALLYSVLFTLLHNEDGAPKGRIQDVRNKYERIIGSPSLTLGVTPLSFDDALKLCYPIIDSVKGEVYLTSTAAAISLLRAKEDFLQQLIVQSSLAVIRKYHLSIGLKGIMSALKRGCSLIF